MTVAIVTLDRNRTPQDWEQIKRAKPPASGRLAGGVIADMISLKRAFALCSTCQRKLGRIPDGYVVRHNIPFVRGPCDGCSEWVDRARLHVHHSHIPVSR